MYNCCKYSVLTLNMVTLYLLQCKSVSLTLLILFQHLLNHLQRALEWINLFLDDLFTPNSLYLDFIIFYINNVHRPREKCTDLHRPWTQWSRFPTHFLLSYRSIASLRNISFTKTRGWKISIWCFIVKIHNFHIFHHLILVKNRQYFRGWLCFHLPTKTKIMKLTLSYMQFS